MNQKELAQKLPELAGELDRLWADYLIRDGGADIEGFVSDLHVQGRITEDQLRDVLTSMDVVITLSEMSLRDDGPRYRALSLLGKGAMGEIHMARDRVLRRNVAVKRMDPRIRDDRMLASRFHTEAQITAQLDHPGVVPVYSLEFLDDGVPEYSMKLIRGQNLNQVLKGVKAEWDAGRPPGPALSLTARLEWFLQVCATLAYAHDRGVLHRDLKPDNIMIGPFHEVVLMDWGIAKLLDSDDDDALDVSLGPAAAHETQMGTVLGTLQYMAPEQARGERDRIDARSDQYALGLVLFEIVTLNRALKGKNKLHLAFRAQEGEKEPLVHHAGQHVPGDLAAIIDKATRFKRADRYASVEAMADDIRRFLRDEAILARPDGALQRIERWVGRHRTATLAALVGLAGLVVAVGTVTVAGGLVALEASRYAAAVREQQLAEVISVASSQARRIDQDLMRQQGIAVGIAFAAEEALSREAPDIVFYHENVWTDPVLAPPDDMVEAPFYVDDISLGHVDLVIPPIVDAVALEPQSRILASLQPALERAQRLSIGPDGPAIPDDELAPRVLVGGVPAVWTYVATEDGLMAGYPGQGDYPDDYDPRDRPWYRVCKANNAPSWSALDIDEGNMGLLLTLTVPMHDQEGEFMGVAALDLTFGHVIDNLLEPQGLDVPVEAFLIDEAGHVVVRSSQKDIARSATDYAPEPFPYADILEAMQTSDVGHRERTEDGTTTLVAWSRLEATGWIYAIEGETAALLATE